MEPLNIENPSVEKGSSSSSKKHIIFYTILGLIIIGLIIALIIVSSSEDKEEKEKIVYNDEEVLIPNPYPVLNTTINYNYFGNMRRNLSYDKDGVIKNTFGTSGSHYIEEVGNIHNGEDYKKTESNVYDLYIPEKALLNKNGANGINGIILFIHGGAWNGGWRFEEELFFSSYGKIGYITANMEYTLLVDGSKDTNIFRIVDEISACIADIKERLKQEGFDENYLELAIFGYSAGAHLTLLYSYLIDDSPIKIKFTVNMCGPISLERHLILALKVVNDTLPSLEKSEVEKAFSQGRLNQTTLSDSMLLQKLNLFLGSKYTKNELEEMIIKNGSEYIINYENEKFQDLHNRTKHAFPLYIEDKNKVPVLCFYGGNDEVVGVMAYGYLEEKAKKVGKTIELIYSKYSIHNFYKFEVQDNVECLRTLNVKILEFADRYFGK